jgi:hypothetical protein
MLWGGECKVRKFKYGAQQPVMNFLCVTNACCPMSTDKVRKHENVIDTGRGAGPRGRPSS